jgi:SnoaL-like domain
MTESAAVRSQVIETYTRMAWHADERDWRALRDVFADEVRLDYTSLQGGERATVSRDQLAESWAGLLGKLQATQHLLTNHLVTVDGDDAVCTAAFQATHLLPNPHGDPIWTLGGTYRFELVRDGSRWRISAVTMTATWARAINRSCPWPSAPRPEHALAEHPRRRRLAARRRSLTERPVDVGFSDLNRADNN